MIGTLAVPLSLGAAVSYGVASALQAHEARRSGETTLRGLTVLLRRPLWLLGISTDILGLICHVLALGMAPASLVQPLQVAGLLIAFPLTRRLRGLPAGISEVAPAALLVAGLAAFLAVTRPQEASRSLDAATAAYLIGTALLGLAVTFVFAKRFTARVRALSLAAASGSGFAVTAVLLDNLGRQRQLLGWAALVHPAGFVALGGTVIIGALAVAVSQAAFEAAPVNASLPMLSVLDPVVAVALGGVLLGETPRFTAVTCLVDLLALFAVVGAVVTLARVADLPANAATDTQRRRWLLAGLAAATIGALYGLLPAVVGMAVQQRVDPDSGTKARLVVLAATVLASAAISATGLPQVIRRLWHNTSARGGRLARPEAEHVHERPSRHAQPWEKV